MGKSLANTSGLLGETKRYLIPGMTSPFWPANPALCAVSFVVAIGSRPKANAPFKEWDLPLPIRRVWRKLERQPDGDRQMVEILSAVLTDGAGAVEAACAKALSHNVHSAGVVLNILARRHAKGALPARRTATAPDHHHPGCAEAGL